MMYQISNHCILSLENVGFVIALVVVYIILKCKVLVITSKYDKSDISVF